MLSESVDLFRFLLAILSQVKALALYDLTVDLEEEEKRLKLIAIRMTLVAAVHGKTNERGRQSTKSDRLRMRSMETALDQFLQTTYKQERTFAMVERCAVT